MPNKDVHEWTSASAGVAFATYRAWGLSREDLLPEILGGLVGGWLGGKAPDVLDPPTSPNHRGLGHSAGGAAIVLMRVDDILSNWEEYFRSHANEVRTRRNQQESGLAKAILFVVEMLIRIAGGVASGMIGGYSAHLAFDALTPKSLPLIV